MELLKEICSQYKQTLLIVTHDEKVAAMADRIICLLKKYFWRHTRKKTKAKAACYVLQLCLPSV